MANEELQKLREVAEAREAAIEEKLGLEREARQGMTQRSYAMFFLSCSSAWADPVGCFFAEAEDQVAQGRATLDRLSRPLEALLGAFELKGVAAAESLAERLEASRGRLEACIRGAAKDAVQHTLGLVKTHLSEADLDPVADGVPEDCSDAEWEANHAVVLEIAEHVMAEL